MRLFFGKLFIVAGISILPKGTRAMVRGLLLYNVPGALTEDEKAEVRRAKAGWKKSTAN